MRRLLPVLAASLATALAAPPAAPTALRVAPLGTTAQILSWTDNAGDETGFIIERLDGVTWTPVANNTANTTRTILRSQPAGIQTYRVMATNGDGPSAPSPQAATLRMNVLFFLADDMGYKDIVAHRNAVTDGPTIYETPALDTLVSQGVTFTQAYCSGPKCVVARRAIQTGMYDFRSAAIAKNGGVPVQVDTVGEAMKAGGYRTCFIGKWHLGGHLDGSTGGDENDAGGSFVPGSALPYTDWSSATYVGTNKFIADTDPNHYEGNKTPAAQGYDVAIATGEWGAPPLDPGSTFNPQSKGYYPSQIGVTSQYWYGLPAQIAAPDNTDPQNPVPPPAPAVLEPTVPNEYLTDRLTTVATGFVGDHLTTHPTQPFFLTLAHYAVHTPLQADPARVTYFQNKRTAMNAQFAAHPAGAQFIKDYSSDVRQHQDQPIYAAMMDSFDDSLAAIRTYLAATDDPRNPGMKLADTTIIVLSSDHGGKSTHIAGDPDLAGIPTSNYPLRQGKTWVYEGGLKIPMIVYWPGFSAAAASQALVNQTDIYTTLLDMTGSPRVSGQHPDSISFAESVIVPAHQARVESHHWFTNADDGTGNPALGAYRFGRYKLVYHIIRRVWELYDIAADPGELNDIAALRPDLVAEFYKRLSDRLVAVDGTRPSPISNSWAKELLVLAKTDVPIPAAVPGGAPSGLAGAAVSNTAIDLTWTDNSSDETRFIIHRKTGSNAFAEVATVAANTTRYRDAGLTPNTTYQYRVYAENLKGWNPTPIPTLPSISVTTSSAVPLPVIARGDYITTLINETRVFQPLANDQGRELAITALTQGAKGTATITDGGATITYVPTTGATGEDIFTYTATASDGGASTGYIQLNILANHNTTPAPTLVYGVPTKTDVDVWEFNDAANTTLAAAAKAAGTCAFTGAATPVADGAGNLHFSTPVALRTSTAASPGEKILLASDAGVYEMSFRISAADLTGSANNTFASISLRDATAGADLFAFHLRNASGNLRLQYRNPGSTVIFANAAADGLVLPAGGLTVRAVADLVTKKVTVYYNSGSGELAHGTYDMDPLALKWNCYGVLTSNAFSGNVRIDYLRIKSVVYPAPPTAFQVWMDTAQGSVTPSASKAPDADPDGDGIKNILEYAYGGNPFVADVRFHQFAQHLDTAADADAVPELILTLPVRSGVMFPTGAAAPLAATLDGIQYQVMGSLDLTNFTTPVQEVYPALESGLPPSPRGWEYRSFRLPDSNNPAVPHAFMRAGAQTTP